MASANHSQPVPETTGRGGATVDPGVLYDYTASARLFNLAALVVGFAALYFAKEILLPMALAMLLSFLLAPLVWRIESLGLGRIPSVILVVGMTLVGIGAVGWMVTNQFLELSRNLPDYKGNLSQRIRAVSSMTRGGIREASETVEELSKELTAEKPSSSKVERVPGEIGAVQSAVAATGIPLEAVPDGDTVSPASSSDAVPVAVAAVPESEGDAIPVKVVALPPSPLSQIRDWLGPLVTPLTNAGLVFVLVVFLLLRREDVRNRVIQLVGTANIRLTTEALNDAAGRLSRYLRMQLLINACYGGAAGLGLYLLNVPNALLWGVLALLLRFLPYIGPWLAAAMPLVLTLAVFEDWFHPLTAAAMFIVLELVVNNVLEPWLYGTSTGVSSLGIIVAAIFWTWLWGSVGLVLATPLTVCLVVMGKYVPQLQFITILFSDRSTIPLGEHIYQRLLALDEDEVMSIATAFLRTGTLDELYDTGFVPALFLAERERHAGLLTPQQEAFVLHATRELIEEITPEEPEAKTQETSAEAGAEPAGDDMQVLCIAVRDEADELAAEMLAQLLKRRGIAAQVLSTRSLASEVAERAEVQRDIIVLSVMPPLGGRDGRYHCRRLRSQHPDLPIVVGLWTGEEFDHTSERLLAAGATKVVSSLDEAITTVESLRTGLGRVASPPLAATG